MPCTTHLHAQVFLGAWPAGRLAGRCGPLTTNSEMTSVSCMDTWGSFAAARPDLAEAGRAMFYEVGVGLAFLATVRNDGGPRLNPMCPLMDGRGLYAFIIPSPKRGDLVRDGRYSMHSYPRPDDEDAFMVSG